jgi:hypothetical protein
VVALGTAADAAVFIGFLSATVLAILHSKRSEYRNKERKEKGGDGRECMWAK